MNLISHQERHSCLPHLPTWSWKKPLNNLFIFQTCSLSLSLVSCHVTWCIHHSVNDCTSVLCEMQCYYAHKMSMVILVLAIYLYWSARRSQHKVIVIALVHMKTYSVLIGAHCCRALSDPFSTFWFWYTLPFQSLLFSRPRGTSHEFLVTISPGPLFLIVSVLTRKEWHGMIFTAIPPVFLERILGATTTCFQRIATVQALPHSLRLFTQVSIENETLKLKALINEAYLHWIAQAFDFLKPS